MVNKHAIVNASLMKIIIKGYIVKSHCTHTIFSKIRTAHFEISTTHLVLQNTLFQALMYSAISVQHLVTPDQRLWPVA